jgi:Rieske 2Fe-2S family protein
MVSQSASSPAPLDPAALADSLRPFGESRMLPRAAYVDPAVFAWEQQHFFGGGWICVGRSSQFVTMIARGYQGQPVWNTGQATPVG